MPRQQLMSKAAIGTLLGALTAASSGGSAPLAMLCFPNLSLCRCLCGSLSVPSCGTSSASHSSCVATCPRRSEKNLCRSTVLIRSRAWVVYHPSRSLHASRSESSSSASIISLSIASVMSHSWNAAVSDVTVSPSKMCERRSSMPEKRACADSLRCSCRRVTTDGRTMGWLMLRKYRRW